MDSRLQELHLLTNTIFQNVAALTPYLRNVVTHAKQYQKSFQGTCNVADSFILSFQHLAEAAAISNGATKLVGGVLHDIIASFKEVEQMQLQLMKLFINEVIIPLESKAEQEISSIKVSHKGYIHDSKVQTELVEKARQDVAKVRKKSIKKKSKAMKYEQREKDCVRTLSESEQKLKDVREQGLRMALIEERRMFCFVSERMCAYGHGIITHNGKISQLLNDRLPDWMNIIQRPTELPAESEAIIEHPTEFHYGTLKFKKVKRSMSIRSRAESNSSPVSRRVSNASKYHTMDSRSRASAASSPATSIRRQLSTSSAPIKFQRQTVERQESTSSSDSPNESPTEETPPRRQVFANGPVHSDVTPSSHHHHDSYDSHSLGDMRMTSLHNQLSRKLMQIHPEANAPSHTSALGTAEIRSIPMTIVEGHLVVRRLKLKAMYDHSAQDPSQLTFQKGDVIIPICEPTSGWQYGENTTTALSGWFPSAYTEANDQQHSDVPRPNTLPIHRDGVPGVIHEVNEAPDGPVSPSNADLNPVTTPDEVVANGEMIIVRKSSHGMPPPAKAPKPKWHINNNTHMPPSPSSASLPSMHAASNWSEAEHTLTVPITKAPTPITNEYVVVDDEPDSSSVQSSPPQGSITTDEGDADESSEAMPAEEPTMPAPPPPPPLPTQTQIRVAPPPPTTSAVEFIGTA